MTRRMHLLPVVMFLLPGTALAGSASMGSRHSSGTDPHVLVSNLDVLTAPTPPSNIAEPAKAPERTGLQPAPLPDPDVDGPSEAAVIGPGLTPALFHEKTEFQGSGFSPASNLDHGQNQRRAPAAGLNWVVPVK